MIEEKIRLLLGYEPKSGDLVWLTSYGRKRPGMIAGVLDRQGYIRIRINGKTLMGHRIAWLLSYGRWPDGQIDHKNLRKSDNRLCNLREVGENNFLQRGNQRVRKDSRSKLKGVTFLPRGTFTARIGNKHLGTFSTAQAAHAVYVVEARKLYGKFARVR